MLKNCFLPVNYNKPSQACGEIVYQSFDEFIINCKLCKIKIFNFDDFVLHLKNVHENELVHGIAASTIECSSNLDDEEDGSNNFLQMHIIDSKKREKDDPDDEEKYNFENEQVQWDVTIENDRFSEEGREYEDSEYEMQCEDEEDDVKSIIKKPRKPKEYSCEICKKKYADERRLHMHVKIVHQREKRFKCSYCDEAFAENRTLQNHIGHQHTGYDCPTCHKNFSSSRNLKRHMLIHVDVKEFICPEESCGKAFASKGLLKDHGRCHSGEILICEECGYKCRQRESLIVHKRHHSGEKPFACKLCDSRFGSKPLLKEHMATHETERKHICDVCGKSFNRPKALYHHKHLHLGIKKFVCKICGQAYAQAAGLSAHMRKHREESGLFSSEKTSSIINQQPNLLNVFYNV